MAVYPGWIDEVGGGWVWGRVVIPNEKECEFQVPISKIPEGQRASLEPGVYIYLVNGCVFINSVIWTTHEMECADREAKRLHAALGWS